MIFNEVNTVLAGPYQKHKMKKISRAKTDQIPTCLVDSDITSDELSGTIIAMYGWSYRDICMLRDYRQQLIAPSASFDDKEDTRPANSPSVFSPASALTHQLDESDSPSPALLGIPSKRHGHTQ